MDERFEEAVRVVLNNEGGFSNDKKDPGGATMHGISLKFLQENDIHIISGKEIGLGDILAITLNVAKEIYIKWFWVQHNIGEIPNLQIATKVLDLSVNMGPVTAIKLLQESINRCQMKPILVDGIIGEQTIDAISPHDILTHRLIIDYRVAAAEHYDKIIQKNPKLAVFRNGWLRRAAQ
jgi:lysozyme family protein